MVATTATAPPHCGLMPPPVGVTPDCVHGETQTAGNIAMHSIMIALATAALFVRLYTRRIIIRKVELDDYLCVLSLALVLAYSAALLTCGQTFLGHHIWDVTKSAYLQGYKYQVVAEWLYCFASPALKLTVLVFYQRIFGPFTRVHYIFNGSILFICVTYTALFFISFLTCMPLSRRFNPFLPGYCLRPGVSAYLSGSINVFTDALVVFLPIFVIGKLNMPRVQKVRAIAVFGIGIVVLALSVTRLAKTPLAFKTKDASWELSNFAIYSVLELYFGFVAICLLASPAFLDRFGPRLMSRIRSYSNSLRPSSSPSSAPSSTDQIHNSHLQGGASSIHKETPVTHNPLEFITEHGNPKPGATASVNEKRSEGSLQPEERTIPDV